MYRKVVMVAPNPDLLAKLQACVDQAQDLLASAHAVFDLGKPHVAYPLAIAAVEELGKRNLLNIADMSENNERDAGYALKRADNHQQKLFWALFGGQSYSQMTPEKFKELQRLATAFHQKRLSSMYVDATADGLSIPKLAVSEEEVRNILGLADALVGMAMAQKPRDDIPVAEIEDQRWFLAATESDEIKPLIFSKASLDKLADLDDVHLWVQWLRAQVAEIERANSAAVEREVERGKSLPEVGMRPKWKVRFRIKSASHSIRPSAFTEWNKGIEAIQLSPAGGAKKRDIIVELTVFDQVSATELFFHAWGMARYFVTALNIATFGFFWWHFSEDQTTWYESIVDLDNPSLGVKVEQSGRAIDWGENRVLTADEMKRTQLVFLALPKPPPTLEEAKQIRYIDAYISALTALAVSDVHMPLESA